ncbi:MAG: rod shape-determining protein MreD [Deltaproteobacteria bacterium]|nr:rod shape-determining protein MreD [Deltaproteobacteria bacterium]
MTLFMVFGAIGLCLFYFQNLALLPYVHLRLLTLLVFYVSLRPSFPLAFWLAVTLGLLQDSFALTPLGFHINGALIIVAVGRYVRRRFLITSGGTQFLASLAALILQEVGLRLTLLVSGYRPFLWDSLSALHGVEILATALLAPLLFSLLGLVERGLVRRWPSAGTADLRLR